MKNNSANQHRGLLAGGNWIIDQVKMIDVYPQPEQLSNIRSQSQGTGGAPYNVLVDLAKSGAPFPLFGAGLVGKDALGQEILEACRQHQIDIRHLGATPKAPTSYTDVMTELGHGRRTFFHARGANALWQGAGLDFERTRPRIFHLGYLLLLDALDEPDAKFGTKAARLLAPAQRAGVKTCVDVVSEDSDRFARIVNPALRYVDYCILNEIEAGKTTGFKIRQAGGQLDTVARATRRAPCSSKGSASWSSSISPKAPSPAPAGARIIWQPSLKLPPAISAAQPGLATPFAPASCWACTKAGTCRAVCSPASASPRRRLSHATCTDGVKSLKDSLALARKFGFNPALGE